MHHLVRVVERNDKKIVEMFLGYFESMEELETRKPDDQAEAVEYASVHNRLNDSDTEARHYFQRMKK